MAVRRTTNSGDGTANSEPELVHSRELMENGEAPRGKHGARSEHSGIPRWRKIEILRERAELKRHLMEIWSDDVDIGDLSLDEDEDAHDRYYTSADADPEPLEDIDEDEESVDDIEE